MTAGEDLKASIYSAHQQPKPWGREEIFAVVEGRFVGKLIHVNAGHSLSCQCHREKEETIFCDHRRGNHRTWDRRRSA